MLKLIVILPHGKTLAYRAPSMDFCDNMIAKGNAGCKYIVMRNNKVIKECNV